MQVYVCKILTIFYCNEFLLGYTRPCFTFELVGPDREAIETFEQGWDDKRKRMMPTNDGKRSGRRGRRRGRVQYSPAIAQ